MNPAHPASPALAAPGAVLSPPRPRHAGWFISVEGIDGAGKSTHLEALAQEWRRRGHDLVLTREPGGTALAEMLREIVLHQRMDVLTEALVVFAARRDHLVQRILPALQAGTTVVCDRFADASFAYQGGGGGCEPEVLQTLERWVVGDHQPDVTLYFDLPPEEAARRRAGARQPDRFEAQDARFFERVHQAYAARMAADPQRFVRIDARGGVPEVWQQVQGALEGLLGPRPQAEVTMPAVAPSNGH